MRTTEDENIILIMFKLCRGGFRSGVGPPSERNRRGGGKVSPPCFVMRRAKGAAVILL